MTTYMLVVCAPGSATANLLPSKQALANAIGAQPLAATPDHRYRDDGSRPSRRRRSSSLAAEANLLAACSNAAEAAAQTTPLKTVCATVDSRGNIVIGAR